MSDSSLVVAGITLQRDIRRQRERPQYEQQQLDCVESAWLQCEERKNVRLLGRYFFVPFDSADKQVL